MLEQPNKMKQSIEWILASRSRKMLLRGLMTATEGYKAVTGFW